MLSFIWQRTNTIPHPRRSNKTNCWGFGYTIQQNQNFGSVLEENIIIRI